MRFLREHSTAAFLLGSVLYSELILRIFTGRVFFRPELFLIFGFSAVTAGFALAIVSFCRESAARVVTSVFSVFTFLNYGTQVVYFLFFGKYLILFSLVAGGTDQVIGDGLITATLSAIFTGLPAIVLLSVPMLAWFIRLKKRAVFRQCPWKTGLARLAAALLAHFAMIGVIYMFPAAREVYTAAFDHTLSVNRFGMAATEWLDLKYNILGLPQNAELAEEFSFDEKGSDTYTTETHNITAIDFDALLKTDTDEVLRSLDTYFADRAATPKNGMTGAFEGYNVVMITGEAFSPYAIDRTLTPTLWKMKQNGITFSQFYTPIWDVSTSDGEYVNNVGLIPKSGVWSMYRSSENHLPFTLGNQMKAQGVDTRLAFHNHNYAFYHRDKSHPNLGYRYLGVGNGLEKFLTDQWPESDLEMMKATVPMLTAADRFCAYYMTVSGHLTYDRRDNDMAAKNWKQVEKLPYSDMVKGYLACQVELDRAMAALLDGLTEAGVADRTLIVLAPDHYPYGLEDDTNDDKYRAINELVGHTVETTFELYKSDLILYCPAMTEGHVVDKPCSSLDILPTLSNLLGFSYDSRLLMGRDIFADDRSLVVFSDRSWITEQGRYFAQTETFEPSAAFSGDTEEYVATVNAVVKNKFKISAMMLESDYYAHVYGVESRARPSLFGQH